MVKKSTIAAIVILSILLVSLIGVAVVYREPLLQSALPSGVTTLSINQVTINNQPRWQFVFIPGGSQELEVRYDPATIGNYAGGVESEKPFIFSASAIAEQVQYNIRSDTASGSPRLYQYALIDIESPSSTSSPGPCPSNSIISQEYDLTFPKRNHRLCFVKTQAGVFGTLSNPSVKFQADLTMSNGVESTTTRIDQSQRSVAIPQGKCTWVGSLITGDPAPNLGLKPFLVTGDRWRFTSDTQSGAFVSSQISKEDLVDQTFSTNADDDQGYNIVMGRVNTLVGQLNTDRVNLVNSQTVGEEILRREGVTTQLPFDPQNANLLLSLDRTLTQPVITCDLAASYIGIKETFGIPKITDVTCPTTKIGDSINVLVDLQNVGQRTGNFGIRKEGCTNLREQFSGFSSQVQIAAGATKADVPLVLTTGSRNIAGLETCTVIAYDIANPARTDSRRVNCEVKQATVCQANQQQPDGNRLYQCNSAGTAQTLIKDCGQTLVLTFQNGQYACVAPGNGTNPVQPTPSSNACNDGIDNDGDNKLDYPNDPGCTLLAGGPLDKDETDSAAGACPNILYVIPNIPCKIKNALETILTLVAVILGVMVFLGFGIGYPFLVQKQGIKVTKKDRRVGWIAGLILGGLIGLLAYFIFELALAFLFVGLLGLAIWRFVRK